MMVRLASARITRARFSLVADAVFTPGIHRVCGAVGSGKSTLALLMAGLLQPSAGVVTHEGIGTFLLSLQFPEYHVTGSTVAEECAAWGIDPDVVLAAEGFTCGKGRDPFTLSRGELKRLHLACVLARPCNLLLLDEPFAALDCQQKESLCRRLSSRRTGIVVLFTHEEEFLPAIDHSWELRGGQLHSLDAAPWSRAGAGSVPARGRLMP